MSEITCPVCGEAFEVSRDTGEGRVCRKAKCAKKKQRLVAAGRWEEFLQSVAGGAAETSTPPQKKPAARVDDALYEDRQGRPVEPKKRGRKEVVPLPTAEQLNRRTRREQAAFPRGDDNSIARDMLKKVPRPSSLPAPAHVPASSILARLKSKLPSTPVEIPRGQPLPKP